jgi:hypothetical protein
VSLHDEALQRYADARDRAELLKAAWEEAGKPTIGEGGATGRAPVVHPLIKAIESAELLAEKLRPAAEEASRALERERSSRSRDPAAAELAEMPTEKLLAEQRRLERRLRS